MSFSLNEIASMGKRAARGAGYSWGLAEEAGKAARWLAAHDLPGPELLAELLIRNDGREYETLAPSIDGGRWQAGSELLCPIIAGSALCDRASEISRGGNVELSAVAMPMLLAPFAAGVAELTGTPVQLAWSDFELTLTGEGIAIKGSPSASTRRAEKVRCRALDKAGPVQAEKIAGRSVDAETWTRLAAFAHRTYAPATEASRLAGAGAGLSDND